MSKVSKTFPGTVLVTGAARGMGAAMAVALAERGIEPILLGRSRESLEGVRERTSRILSHAVRTVAADVGDWQSVQRAIDEVLAPNAA